MIFPQIAANRFGAASRQLGYEGARFHMLPVGIRIGEAERDPARRPEIGRAAEEVGLRLDQHFLLVAAAGLDADAGQAVAVMVVPEIAEHLAGYRGKAGARG